MRQRVIVCPLIQHDGAYLLCRMRKDRGVFPGTWALSGGLTLRGMFSVPTVRFAVFNRAHRNLSAHLAGSFALLEHFAGINSP